MNNQKGLAPIIIVLIAIAIIAGGILTWQYLRVPEEEAKVPEEVPEEAAEDEAADWKTYRNKSHGFEIDYPVKNWIFEELMENGKSYGFTLCRIESEDPEKVCIFMTPQLFYHRCHDLELKEIIEKPYDCMGKSAWGINFEKIITTNTDIEVVIGKGFHIGYNTTAAFFLMPDVLPISNMGSFMFLHYYSSIWDFRETFLFDEEKQETFNQMISTFRF